ncbi:MAG TPA: hypothetical protein VGI10_01405 [Polyangiaceae bacterium]
MTSLLIEACSSKMIDLDHPDNDPRLSDPTIINTVSSVKQLWVDDTRLYWLTPGALDEDSALFGCLKDDCARSVSLYARSVARDNTPSYQGVGIGSERVFWWGSSPQYTLYSCPKAGCPELGKIYRAERYDRLVADQDQAYWASATALLRCDSAGCGATPTVVADAQPSIATFVVAGSDAIWYEVISSEIRRAPKDGSQPPTTLVQLGSADTVTYLAADSDNVYWLDGSQQNAFRCALAGCSAGPTLISSGTEYKQGLVASGYSVYWLEGTWSAPAVRSCQNTGCSGAPVFLTPAKVQAYALDSQYVYWTEFDQSLQYGRYIHRAPR